MKRGIILIILFALLTFVAAACVQQQESVSAAALTPQAATLQALQTAVANLQSTVTVLSVAAADAAEEAEGEGKSENVPVVIPTATPTPLPLPTATLTRATALQGATGVLFSVNRMTWQPKVEGFYPPQGHRWLALDMTLANPLGNPPVDYNPLWFSLADENGSTLSPAPLPGVLFNARLFTLLPGDTVSGRLVFAVPEKWKIFVLQIKDDPLNFQPPVQMRLEVPPLPTPVVRPTEEGGEG